MKKNTLFLLGVLLGIGSINGVSAQQNVCGFEHQQEMYRKSHPATIAENVGALAATRSNASYHQG